MTHLVEAVAAHGGSACSLATGSAFGRGYADGEPELGRLGPWRAGMPVRAVRAKRTPDGRDAGLPGWCSAMPLELEPLPDDRLRRAAHRRGVAASLAGPIGLVDQLQPRVRPRRRRSFGVFLVHRDHPYRVRFETQWAWFTYFFNALVARASCCSTCPHSRRSTPRGGSGFLDWLENRGLPTIATGSYYVKSFRPIGEVPAILAPLQRGDLLRLCFKPPCARSRGEGDSRSGESRVRQHQS